MIEYACKKQQVSIGKFQLEPKKRVESSVWKNKKQKK